MAQDPPVGQPDELPDMAFSMYARTFAACYAIWDDPTGDSANRAWLTSTMGELGVAADGHYVGEADLLTPGRALRSFVPRAWQRLDGVRVRFDPDGVFAGYLDPAMEVSGR
jgi:hypothetical protein